MQYVRGLILLSISLALPLLYGSQARAATEPIVQELHVTAVVPHHRDIIIDQTGTILEIASNTTKDVRPTVYLGSIAPKNKKPLTDKLYKQYRQHVPIGTADYGVLYQRSIPLSLLRTNAAGTRFTHNT